MNQQKKNALASEYRIPYRTTDDEPMAIKVRRGFIGFTDDCSERWSIEKYGDNGPAWTGTAWDWTARGPDRFIWDCDTALTIAEGLAAEEAARTTTGRKKR